MITRGQFSLLDALLHVIEHLRPCKISIWTWRLAKFDLDVIIEMYHAGAITEALMLIDTNAIRAGCFSGSQKGISKAQRGKLSEMDIKAFSVVTKWRETFGNRSVKLLNNHAKIATIEGREMKVLIRGSANMNRNPRFEQFDLTEGGKDFDLVRSIENEIPYLPDNAPNKDYVALLRIDSGMHDKPAIDGRFGASIWRP